MSDEIKIPGPASGYTDLIDKALLAREAETKDLYFPLRPSAAGYCGRKLAYDLMKFYGMANYPAEKREPNVIRLLNFGSSVEWHSIKSFELIKNLEPHLKVKYKQQMVTLFRLDPVGDEMGPLIEGSIDLAIMNSETNKGGIADVKSLKDRFSYAFKSQWDESLDKFSNMGTLKQISETSFYAGELEPFLEELNDPFFADNFWQINAYANTQWAKDHGIDHGSVYRYCKNDSRHLEIRFNPSASLFQKLKEKYNQIYQAVAGKQNPEIVTKDFSLGSSKCAFCVYATQCWNKNTLKAYFQTWPKKKWPTDLDKLGDEELGHLFDAYEDLGPSLSEHDKTEQKILKKLVESEITKIKLDNGNVYEVKHLKSPKPHFQLRRSKQ